MPRLNPDIDLILKNEEKWREYQFKKLDDMDKRLIGLEITAATLKVKIGLISGFFGALSSTVVSFLFTKMH